MKDRSICFVDLVDVFLTSRVVATPKRRSLSQSEHGFQRLFLGLFGCCFAASSVLAADPPAEVRGYQVNSTSTPIVADGIVDAAWADAETAAGDWRMLRQASTVVDNQNYRFRMLWDADNLYMLIESDNTLAWAAHPGGPGPFTSDFDGSVDNMNLFIDPDGGDQDGNFPPENGQNNPFIRQDDYQITYNMHSGTWVCDSSQPCSNPTASFPGRHDGTVFGTSTSVSADGRSFTGAEWDGMRDTTIAQINTDGVGSVVELTFPWTEFDADAITPPDAPNVPNVITGLDHAFAPENGETWIFSAGVITQDLSNFLPVWNWTSSNGFANTPHGEITFVEAVSQDGDFDNDGDVDGYDFLVWQQGGSPGGATPGDLTLWENNYGVPAANAAAVGVPEPASLALFGFGLAALVAVRRRRVA